MFRAVVVDYQEKPNDPMRRGIGIVNDSTVVVHDVDHIITKDGRMLTWPDGFVNAWTCSRLGAFVVPEED
jgi:hypothetical protein